jgi:methylmalonyl-CoA carboxyltransferase large subunit
MNIFVLGMANPEIGLGALIALFVIGWLVTYLAVRNATTRELDSMHEQVAVLTQSVQRLAENAAGRPMAMAVAAGAQSSAAPVVTKAPIVTPVPAAPEPQEISEEVLVVIAAAVAAFMGKKARIRHTRLVQPSEANAWAQQGRVFVQASHNLGVSHHA